MTRGYRGLHWVTGGYKGLQEVTGGYKGLQGVTSGVRQSPSQDFYGEVRLNEKTDRTRPGEVSLSETAFRAF